MPLSRALFLIPAVLAGAAISIASCSTHDGGGDDPCPPPAPAFGLIVRAQNGAVLSRKTTIVVKYGSGEETFDVSDPNVTPLIAFCSVEPPGVDGGVPDAAGVDATDGGTDVGSVACALWTDGAADVTVMSDGYGIAEQTFQAMSDRCGVFTTPALIELMVVPVDGGP